MSHRIGPAALLPIVLVAIAFLATACSWVDPFPEYRGVNLIENRGFTIDGFIEAYGDGSDPGTTPDYVLLTTPAAYGPTTGLPDTSTATLGSIRSLEIVNLLPNGDFEDGTIAPWITDGAGLEVSGPTRFEPDNAGELTGWYAAFEISTAQGAAVDLDALPIPVVLGGRYFLQARFRRAATSTQITLDFGNAETTSYIALNGTRWVFEEPGGPGPTVPEEVPDRTVPLLDVPLRFTVISSPNYLYLGSPVTARTQQGYLDDVRLGRLDNVPHRALSIMPAGSAEQLPLVAGRYTFSVFVKSEVDSEVTPASANRFRARQIVLGANGRLVLFRARDHGWDADTWVRLSTVIDVTPEQIAEDRPLVLQMTLIDPLEPAVGSILVARPELVLGRR